MNVILLRQPPVIVFGNGSARTCAGIIARRGFKRVLLVSSTPVLNAIKPLLDEFTSAGLTLVHAPPVDSEPSIGVFNSVLEAARATKPEAVLGIGGGSALDVAKLVAALASGRQHIRDVFGTDLLESRALFLVCVPTTAGTGSEVSPNAILLDETDQAKKGVVSPYLVPDAAVVDPLLTVSVPPAVTAATGFDALIHCIEAYANKNAHPVTDLYALEGIRLIGANLLSAVRNGADLNARAAVAQGSLYGGLCLGPVGTAAVHALAYPLGGRYRVPHGVANAVLLTHVLKFNLPTAPERYAQIALALGADRGPNAIATAERGVTKLSELAKACGLPQKLSELGIERSAIPELARAAIQVTRLLKNNVRPMSEQDAVQIYSEAW
ncbi:MAG: iron-containing alcohol dehydrogenase [Verrucomicrobiae bacterium]|nr:iron-containing alcohol dehydrogenase [Verrucomicrobiae bacterium]